MIRQVSQKGFTLVETMMVVAIVAILVSIGGVSMVSGRQAYQFANEQSKLYQVLSRARNMAMGRRECVRVEIVSNIAKTDTFTDNLSNRTCAGAVNPTHMDIADVQFMDKTNIGRFQPGEQTVIFFNGSGGLDASNVVTIGIGDDTNYSTFKIFPVLGQIRQQ